MKLVADAVGTSDVPSVIAEVQLSASDATLDAPGKKALAETLVFGDEYQQSKDTIVRGVDGCTKDLIEGIAQHEDKTDATRLVMLSFLAVVVVLFVALTLFNALMNRKLVVLPIHGYIRSIDEDEPLSSEGSEEMRKMAESYNVMYAQNHQKTAALEHQAQTDALTGLLNRGSYDKLLEQNKEDVALVLIDVDVFKQINDTYGHNAGDEALRRVAACIQDEFRTSDYACRIGGDEFAIIMTKMQHVSRSIVERKLHTIADELRCAHGNLPPITFSVGVAFSDQVADGESMYRAVDSALYQAKDEGRDSVCFYGA